MSDTGNVYSWGDGSLGALGHGDRSNQSAPSLVHGLEDKQTAIREVVSGFAYSVAIGSMCYCKENSPLNISVDKQVYSWGFGRIGHDDAEYQPIPRVIANLQA